MDTGGGSEKHAPFFADVIYAITYTIPLYKPVKHHWCLIYILRPIAFKLSFMVISIVYRAVPFGEGGGGFCEYRF